MGHTAACALQAGAMEQGLGCWETLVTPHSTMRRATANRPVRGPRPAGRRGCGISGSVPAPPGHHRLSHKAAGRCSVNVDQSPSSLVRSLSLTD